MIMRRNDVMNELAVLKVKLINDKPVYANQVIDGALLSDAGVYYQTGSNSIHFEILVDGAEHIDWLLSIKNALTTLGIYVPCDYPIIRHKMSRGKHYMVVRVVSSDTQHLKSLRDRWYPHGIKIVPDDLVLTPIVLANWFIGDGSTSWMRTPAYLGVILRLCTNSCTESEVDRLIDMINRLGIDNVHKNHCISNTSGLKQPIIVIREADTINEFIKLIAPYVCDSYRYKLKLPCGDVL